MSSAPRAVIDLSALHHNLEQVRKLAPSSRILAVVKANAYGHGLLRIVNALSATVDALAVARVGEGISLRQAGITSPIVVLEGCLDQQELNLAADNQLEIVVHSSEQVKLLQQQNLSSPIVCWLKVDTGMHRLGLPVSSALAAYQALASCKSVLGKPRLMTHFANADDLSDTTTNNQWQLFQTVASELDTEISGANSGAILGWPETHADWVRPGIMLYGVSPFINGRPETHDLHPVMNLQSQLIAINHYKKGDAVGYSGTWVCPEDMPIGVVSIGYGDGYPRHAKPGTPVLLNGQRVPLVGRVSMDMITLDLRTCPEAKIGDQAILWGAGLPVEEIAEAASTIPYQLLCNVTARVAFVEE
ncbi:alanine racemase [Pseudomonadota bacterium]